ncbi:TetR/AcrR family transcriptional regulator [Saccharothrix yanglingensis]|uniref:TetR family transcriptional regulator n=1 Tax=Saccharothrix yanglingensis TaxID=659496 RepID=A0ABU0WYT3_9PSEU|nr:TetR/AcrR family transcriptional regulator [Saccharothrix yanglingensis]MDQ2584961.1 TetR family transcriptional regulator [Saccharothrix yanglingensis]
MPEPRSRRRGAELEAAILDAAWAELTEVGYARLTMEAVAARAGTSKPVVYRRWPSRAALVLAAWGHRVPVSSTPVDTGDLREDLVALFTLVARRADSMMNEMIAGVMGEAFRHPEVAEVLRDRLTSKSPLSGAVEQIVARAVARGELPEVEIPHRVARVPLDLVRNESTMCGVPVADDTIAELVDDIYLPLLRGLACRGPSSGRGVRPRSRRRSG